jgi:hypothetical protein
MLVREIWYSWVNKFSYFLNPHAINVLLYRMKPRKHIHVKYCWQTYFKSIGTLSQTFKNHIHNNIVTVACKWCVPSASDVFLSKNDNSGRKTHEASEEVEYDIYFMEYDCCPVWSRVLMFTHCPQPIRKDIIYSHIKYHIKKPLFIYRSFGWGNEKTGIHLQVTTFKHESSKALNELILQNEPSLT